MYKKGVGRKWTRQFLENEASTRAWRKFHRSRNDSSSGLGLRNYTYCYAILFSGFRVTFSFFFFPFSLFFSFFAFVFVPTDRGVTSKRSLRSVDARSADGSGSVQSISYVSYVRTSSKRRHSLVESVQRLVFFPRVSRCFDVRCLT